MFNGEYKPMFLEFKVHHYYLLKFVSILCFVGVFLLLKCFMAYDGILLGVILTASPGLKHSAPKKEEKSLMATRGWLQNQINPKWCWYTNIYSTNEHA